MNNVTMHEMNATAILQMSLKLVNSHDIYYADANVAVDSASTLRHEPKCCGVIPRRVSREIPATQSPRLIMSSSCKKAENASGTETLVARSSTDSVRFHLGCDPSGLAV